MIFREDADIKETYFSEGSSNTYIIRELNCVGLLNFRTDYGHTSMGGNAIYINYLGRDMLHVYFQARLEECEVRRMCEENRWLPELKRLMRNYPKTLEKILAQRDGQVGKKKNAAQEENQLQKKYENLQKEAKRLGLTAE